MEILKIVGLTKKYKVGDSEVMALNHVSFSINEGEFVSILGPSGSGKSTLLHLIGGVDKATEGKVIINEIDISALTETELAIFRRRQIGLIYQFYNLIPILDVEENILLPLLLDNRKQDETFLSEILNILGLDNRKKHLPSQLSGGQQQRVSIGRAIITKPSIILADEPTGNLDRKNGSEIMKLFRRMNQTYGQTIIMITHDEEIAKQSNRVIRIEDGNILSDTYNT